MRRDEPASPALLGEPAIAPSEIVLDGATLTPEAVTRVARHGAPASLHPAARTRNQQAREAIEAMLARGDPLYGASSGVGALRAQPVESADRATLQWNLLRSHAVDAGPPLPEEVVRAAMAVRANQLGAGGAGVAPVLLERLVQALVTGDVPPVGSLGSLGTGDLPGLARIALHLLHGAADGEEGPALGLRDALGFMSSNALTAGRGCLLCSDVRALLDLWLDVAALSFEAVDADPVVLAAGVQAAAGGPGQIAVAARLRAALAITGPAERPASRAGPVQAPYPFRVVPQVDGVSAEAVEGLRRVLGREINARAENALIEDGRALTNGNFHAAALTAALDGVRAALAGSAGLIAARVSALLDPALSGLPVFLAGTPGRDSGMMMLEYTAQAATAEVRSLALPLLAHSMPVSMGVESHASLAPASAARLAEQLPALRVLVATELVVALRALEVAGRRPQGEHTAWLYRRAVAALPAGLADRDFGADVRRATGLVEELLASDRRSEDPGGGLT